MARDAALEALLDGDLAALQPLEQRRMFGGLCWMWRGHLLCGADTSGLLLRLGKGRDEGMLTEPGVSPMVMGGKRMEGWVRLSAASARDATLRHRLLTAAQDFVAGLPAR